jgi:hypothetical protein
MATAHHNRFAAILTSIWPDPYRHLDPQQRRHAVYELWLDHLLEHVVDVGRDAGLTLPALQQMLSDRCRELH